ncbi:MAG: helix-turn-helix transcriptional regulator [Erysipelotrichaceae bacterium]|nr:helix-turn-helix transcriptional regulator [Erysipelotrichaceae bacterium]
MISVKEQLGMRIKYLRGELGWSQEELSFHAKINTTYLSDLENGRRNPSLNILNRLANAFNISLSELFKGIIDFNR